MCSEQNQRTSLPKISELAVVGGQQLKYRCQSTNLRGCCIEYEAGLQDVDAALAAAEIQSPNSILSSIGAADLIVPSTIAMDPN